jgi:hypothetical protein
MFEFILGFVAGSVVTVLVPAVYNWVKAKTDAAKAKL